MFIIDVRVGGLRLIRFNPVVNAAQLNAAKATLIYFIVKCDMTKLCAD